MPLPRATTRGGGGGGSPRDRLLRSTSAVTFAPPTSGGDMRSRRFVIPLLMLALAVALSGPLVAVADDATPTTAAMPAAQPSQPATGPGGAEFAYDGIRAQHYGPEPDGSAAPTGYWLFEPLAPRS